MKVVINTHPKYKKALNIILDSLKYKDHNSDVIVCVADVPDAEAENVVAEYVDTYGLTNVVTCSDNIDEYTAYVGLRNAFKDGRFVDDRYFLMIHDTCEAGRLFWSKLDELEKALGGPKFDVFPDADTFKCNEPIMHQIYASDGSTLWINFYVFVYHEGRLVTSCSYTDNGSPKTFTGFLANDYRITQSVEHAMTFDSGSLSDIRDKINKGYLWYPVSANFNIGVATREFIDEYAGKAFEGMRVAKEVSIDIEINPENPLNLQTQAGDKWRFAYCMAGDKKTCRIPTMSIWANDTDVYGDGNKRNVSFMHAIDLKKYSVLVGKLWSPSHPNRR